MKVEGLQCEYLNNPQGIDLPTPVFSWYCISEQNGDEQTAYRIVVSTEKKCVWDSGKVESYANQVCYQGDSLQSNTRYVWQMYVWDKCGKQSPISEIAFFHTGILNNEWKAKWIGWREEGLGLPVFNKRFLLDKPIRYANVFFSGLGMVEVQVNDCKVGDALFEPGETDYNKKVFYSSYDVTDLLRNGENAIYAYIGKGFYYNPPVEKRFNRTPKCWGPLMFFVQLEIEYDDGTRDTIVTDDSWDVKDGPITECCWLGGEDYDARKTDCAKEQEHAVKACIVKNLPFRRMEARKYPPVKIMEEIKPAAVIPLWNGDYTIDFGKNFAGIFRYTATSERDRKVFFYPAESINEDGSVNQSSTLFGSNKIYDTYIFRSNETESYRPKFVYHGMRYLQVSGGDAENDMICGYVVHCANEIAGKIVTSDNNINMMDKIINRSISDNMFHVVTDCPHREKLGWMEVPHLLYHTIANNYNIAAYTRKIVGDLCDTQAVNGSVPSIVPPYTTGIKEHALREGTDTTPNDPIWCGALVMLPFYSYQRYGDRELLQNTYPAMNRYMNYLMQLSENYLIHGSALNRDLGDWVSLEATSVSFAVSCMYYQLARTMAETSEILQDIEQARKYLLLADRIRNAINESFFHKNEASYDTGSQTANALPVYLNIVPVEYKEKVLEQLIHNIEDHDYHITTGEYGMRPLLNVLSENGHRNLVYRMLTNETPPSYQHFVNLGKTSLPETWSGDFSQNHCILGHGGGWIYEYLAGIRNAGIAFDQIIIEPYFPNGMETLSVSLKCSKGIVAVNWVRHTDRIVLTLNVPIGAVAKVSVPSRKILSSATKMTYEGEMAFGEINSGTYVIEFE